MMATCPEATAEPTQHRVQEEAGIETRWRDYWIVKKKGSLTVRLNTHNEDSLSSGQFCHICLYI